MVNLGALVYSSSYTPIAIDLWVAVLVWQAMSWVLPAEVAGLMGL